MRCIKSIEHWDWEYSIKSIWEYWVFEYVRVLHPVHLVWDEFLRDKEGTQNWIDFQPED